MEITTRLLLLSRQLLPRAGLLLYLSAPNSTGKFLLPADADIRAATGWISGTGNIFYDAVGDPISVFASEIADWSSVNQWNILFHLVSADTETGRLAIYSMNTPITTLNKALRVLREDQIDLTPTAFFNGLDTTGMTSYTGGPTYAPDHLGVLRSPGAGLPALQGMRLATTVANGALLGPELITQPVNLSVGWVTASGASVVSANSFTTSLTASNIRFGIALTLGLTYRVVLSGTSNNGSIRIRNGATGGTLLTGSGYVDAVCDDIYKFQIGSTVTVDTISNVSMSIKQIIPTWLDTTITGEPILPSVERKTRTGNTDFTEFIAGTTFKKYTRTNPAVDLPGYLCEPARTNKVTCRKANPVDTSGLTKSGDAAAILSVVDDTAALTAAGLIGLCNSGKVYKLDNSLGTGAAWISCGGLTVNTNKHSSSAYIRGGSGSIMAGDISDLTPFTTNETYRVIKAENFTPLAGTDKLFIKAYSGQVVYFILPQLEEGPFCTSPIAKLADGTDPLTAITRAGTVLTYPTAGKIRSNDIAFKLSAVPRGAGQSGYLWGSYTDASNFTYLSINPYDITFKSVVNGFSQDLAIADYTHKADTPFEVILCKSTKGSQLLVREYSAGVWQPWVRGGFSVASDNLVVGSTYTLGAFNNAGQFAGNISELDALLIPAGIANPVAWVESQWGVNDAVSNPVIFNHTFTGLTLLDGVLRTKSASDSVTINWGDGTSNTYSGTADTAFTHTYASATTVYNVTYTASDNSVLTRMGYTDRAGSKVGGLLSLPAGMTYFICRGSNTLSGVLSLPASMTLFYCSGSNTLSGALSLPAGMTYFICRGSNTLSGVLSLPASMTLFNCTGSNTLSGVLSLPAEMTYFICDGSNTLSGVLSLPAGMTLFSCAGFNTFSGYTPSTKASNQNRFSLDGLNTLSAANVDAIIQDYAAAGGTWTGDKVFSMTVLAASNRTAASDAAWATLGTKGLVTRTITLR